jgi:hypothetical protein
VALIQLDAGSRKEIANSVSSWAAYIEGEMVTLVGVFSTTSNPPISTAQANATLRFQMTKDVAGRLVRQLEPWLPPMPPRGD